MGVGALLLDCRHALNTSILDRRIDGIASIAYIASMATLTIRSLPNDVRDKLRVKAARAGRSMEAEARAILIESLCKRKLSGAQLSAGLRRAQNWVAAHRRPVAGETSSVDALIRDRRREVIAEVIEQGLDPESYFGGEFERICREAEWTADHVRKLRDGST